MKLSLYRLKALAWKGFVAAVAFSFLMAIKNAYSSTDHQIKFSSGSKKNLSVNNVNVFNIASKVVEAIENLEHPFEESDEADIHTDEEMPEHEDYGVANDQNDGVNKNEGHSVANDKYNAVNKIEDHSVANIEDYGVNKNKDHGVSNDGNYGINKDEDHDFANNEDHKVIIDEDHSVNNDKEVKEIPNFNKNPDSTVNHPQSSGENSVKETAEDFIYDEVLNYRNKSTRSIYVSGHQYPNKDLCPNDGEDIEAIIIIPTSQWLRRRRDPIRKTWSKVESDTKIVVAFLSGKPNSAAREMDLKKEMDEFGDIIVDSMEDSYTNLPLKIISILEWVSLYCSKATYLMKADDDVFVNTELLKAFIQENKAKTDTIFGRYIRKPWPSRITSRKFYVTREEYPGGSYPAYVTGPSYLVPVPAAKEIFHKSLTMPYFRYEDIFLMGMVADRIHIKREHSHKFCLARSLQPKPCYANQCIAVHNIKDNLQFTFWESKMNNEQC